MTDKRTIDLLIARNTGVPQKTVTKVTTELVAVLREQLVRRRAVQIHGLGTFKVHPFLVNNNYGRTKHQAYKVSFSKSGPLRDMLKKHGDRHERTRRKD